MEKLQEMKHSLMQIFLGVVTSCNLPAGMALGFSAITLPILWTAPLETRITEDQASWIASMTPIAMPIGSLISVPLMNAFGRKMMLIVIFIILTIGWIIIGTASYEPNAQYITLLIGRFITGLGAGLSGTPPPVYLSEICTPKIRGFVTPWNSGFVCLGFVLIHLIGYYLQENWRKAALISAVVSVIHLLAICVFMPESPQWLVSNNRVKEAKKSVGRIRCLKSDSSQVVEEVEAMIAKKITKKYDYNSTSLFQKIKTKMALFLSPGVMKPFVIMAFLFLFQQFTGVLAIGFYAVEIARESRFTIDPYLAAIYQGLCRTVATIISSYACKWFGRRPPILFSGLTMSICILSLAGYLYADMNSLINAETSFKFSWIPATLMIMYFFLSSVGVMPIPFAMVGEIYPEKLRDTLSGMTIALGFMFNFIAVKIYPFMNKNFKIYGVFTFYGSMALMGTLFALIFLPETKDKTLEEIEEYFDPKEKVDKVLSITKKQYV